MDWFLYDADLRLKRVKPDALYLPLESFFLRKVKQKSGYIFFSLWNSLKCLRKFEDAFVNEELTPFLVTIFEIFYNDQRNVKFHSEFAK